MRSECKSCRRATSTCYCQWIHKVDTNTRFIILVHPEEDRNRLGSARIASLSLNNSATFVGIGSDFDRDKKFMGMLSDPGYQTYLLFPKKDAKAVESLGRFGDQEDSRPLQIVVLDGTWSKAKGMLFYSDLLKQLPTLSFSTAYRSQYRIRKQPEPYCLSTLESIVCVISSMEGQGWEPKIQDADLDAVLTPFYKIADFQIEHVVKNKDLPKSIRDHFQNLTVRPYKSAVKE